VLWAGLGRDERIREKHARFYRELVDKARQDEPRLARELAQIRWSLETAAKFQSSPFGRDYDIVDRKHKLESFMNILPTLQHGGDLAEKARTLHNIGCVYRDLGEKRRALEYYEQALPIRRDLGDLVGQVHTLYNLASLHRDLGDRKRALDHYAQALPLWRKVGDLAALGRTLNRIGRVHADHEDPRRAREAYEQALSVQREAGDRGGEATTLFDIASALEKNGEIPAAIALGAEAVEIAEELGSPQAEAGRAYLEALRAKQHQIEAKGPIPDLPDPPNSIRTPHRRPVPSDPTLGGVVASNL
jgi:tetratricopeptide (TPR) repeat protein